MTTIRGAVGMPGRKLGLSSEETEAFMAGKCESGGRAPYGVCKQGKGAWGAGGRAHEGKEKGHLKDAPVAGRWCLLPTAWTCGGGGWRGAAGRDRRAAGPSVSPTPSAAGCGGSRVGQVLYGQGPRVSERLSAVSFSFDFVGLTFLLFDYKVTKKSWNRQEKSAKYLV